MSQFNYDSRVTPSAYAAPDSTAMGRDGHIVKGNWLDTANAARRSATRPIGYFFDSRQREAADRASSIVKQIRASANNEDLEDGVFLIYETIDALLTEGAFYVCDLILDEYLMRLPTVHLLAVLSITSPARSVLKCRAKFARGVRERLSEVEGARVEELLVGLE